MTANLSAAVTGLTQGATYLFTFRATNAASDFWATNVQSFTTLAPPPPLPLLPGSAITLTGGVARFTFAAVPGYQYRLASKGTLTDACWMPVIAPPAFPPPEGWSAAATGSLMSLCDTNVPGQSQRFYRLEASNPP